MAGFGLEAGSASVVDIRSKSSDGKGTVTWHACHINHRLTEFMGRSKIRTNRFPE